MVLPFPIVNGSLTKWPYQFTKTTMIVEERKPFCVSKDDFILRPYNYAMSRFDISNLLNAHFIVLVEAKNDLTLFADPVISNR